MTPRPKKYHHDYYFGPEGMTEHDDWRQASYDPKNQRPPAPNEEKLEEPPLQEPVHAGEQKPQKRNGSQAA